MRASIFRLTAVLAVSALCFLSPTEATAGPLRDRVREARPGWIFPKSSAPAPCNSCATDRVQGAPERLLPRRTGPAQVTTVRYSGGGCSGGSCPAPPADCPGGRCPLPR